MDIENLNKGQMNMDIEKLNKFQMRYNEDIQHLSARIGSAAKVGKISRLPVKRSSVFQPQRKSYFTNPPTSVHYPLARDSSSITSIYRFLIKNSDKHSFHDKPSHDRIH